MLIEKWRKLDNSAKLFPIISNKRFSTVFRISVILKEKIHPEILKEATEITLNKYSSFKVRLKKGFFWYYLEFNAKEVIIEEENSYPCKYIDKYTNNDYLLKVTYFENKINMDVFHSLTDGNTATDFFKELVYNYLELTHKADKCFVSRGDKRIVENNTEDSYIKNYNKKLQGNNSTKKAYILQGKPLPFYAIGVIHGLIDLMQLKQICKEKGTTVTQYLTAVLIKAIYEANYKLHSNNKPIKVCIPVNLKKYFSSTTLTNFFSYITLEAQTKNSFLESFDKILEFVKQDFQKRLRQEEIEKTMAGNVKLGNNLLIRAIPLFLKQIILKIGYIEIRKYTTTTFSNIGRMGVLPEYKQYIDNFLFLIAPEQAEKIKCSACSYENNIVFTFTSTLEDIRIQEYFFNFLEKQNICVRIESNGVYDVIS